MWRRLRRPHRAPNIHWRCRLFRCHPCRGGEESDNDEEDPFNHVRLASTPTEPRNRPSRLPDFLSSFGEPFPHESLPSSGSPGSTLSSFSPNEDSDDAIPQASGQVLLESPAVRPKERRRTISTTTEPIYDTLDFTERPGASPGKTPKQCGWVRYKIHELGGRVRRGTWKDGFALLSQGFLQFYEDEAHVNGLETPVLTFCVINGAVSDAEGFTKKNHAILISGSQFIMRKKVERMELLLHTSSSGVTNLWKKSLMEETGNDSAIKNMIDFFRQTFNLPMGAPPLPSREGRPRSPPPRVASPTSSEPDDGYVNFRAPDVPIPVERCDICAQTGERYFYTAKRAHLQVHFDEVLGRQGSNVFAADLCGRPESVAVKQIPLHTLQCQEKFREEVKLMRQFVGREGFVQYLDCVEDKNVGLIVMERCDATFLDVINEACPLPGLVGPSREAVLIDLARQIFEAIRTLGCGDDPIAHRDLKPDNLFIKVTKKDQKLLAKIGDFGQSREFFNHEYQTTEHHGHLLYLSPELLRCYERATKVKLSPSEWRASDMFAIGCTLGQLFTQKHPFGTRVSIPNNVTQGAVCFHPIINLPFIHRGQLGNLIRALTQHDPQLRPTAAACLDHPLFQDAANKVTRLSEATAILKRIEFGEERKDPDRQKLLDLYDQTSELLIGQRGNWLELVHPKFRSRVTKGFDITKTSSLCRFLRNLISHLREDEPALMDWVFGRRDMSQAELFQEFEQIWPLLDGHNYWFLKKEKEEKDLFADAQESLEKRLRKESSRKGTLLALRTYNEIRLSINDGPVEEYHIRADAKVGALIPLEKIKQLVRSLHLVQRSVQLSDERGNKLREPIMDGDLIRVKGDPSEVKADPSEEILFI